jgi:DNA-binding transcriptional ArsR family regulator
MKDLLQPKKCAKLLYALAAPERLAIVRFLRDGPRNVTEIAEMLETAMVNASHHLTVLRQAGLLSSERHGRFVHYSLPACVLQEGEEAGATDRLDLGCCRLEIPKPKERSAGP